MVYQKCDRIRFVLEKGHFGHSVGNGFDLQIQTEAETLLGDN